MDRNDILKYLNDEIQHLTSVRDLLSGQQTEPRRRGRPKGVASRAISFNPEEFAPEKRRAMSPEGKARIAAAQKKRWAAQKSKPVKKTAAGKSLPARKGAPATARKAGVKPSAKPAAKKAPPKKAPAKAVAPVKAAPAAEE